MSVEQVLDHIAAAKLLVNNVYQSRQMSDNDPIEWVANLRSPGTIKDINSYFDFGRGATLEAALWAALAKASEGGIPKQNNVPKFLPKAHVSVKAPSLADIL